jgi:hypothetical protein
MADRLEWNDRAVEEALKRVDAAHNELVEQVDDMAGDLRAHFTAVNERLDAMEKKREAAREADIAWKRDLRKTLINTAGIVLVAFIGLGGTITAALIVTGG